MANVRNVRSLMGCGDSAATHKYSKRGMKSMHLLQSPQVMIYVNQRIDQMQMSD
jgi:hypothetical protein